MDVAALATAIASALVAAGSLIYARRSAHASDRSAGAAETSADAAKKTAWLQSEDDWRARTPTFEIEWNGVIERQGNAEIIGATLKCRGPERYESVQLRLLEPPAGDHRVVHALIDLRGSTIGTHIDLGPVDVGQRLRFGVQPEFDGERRRRGGTVDLQVVAQTLGDGVAEDEWVVPAQLTVPHPPIVC